MSAGRVMNGRRPAERASERRRLGGKPRIHYAGLLVRHSACTQWIPLEFSSRIDGPGERRRSLEEKWKWNGNGARDGDGDGAGSWNGNGNGIGGLLARGPKVITSTGRKLAEREGFNFEKNPPLLLE